MNKCEDTIHKSSSNMRLKDFLRDFFYPESFDIFWFTIVRCSLIHGKNIKDLCFEKGSCLKFRFKSLLLLNVQSKNKDRPDLKSSLKMEKNGKKCHCRILCRCIYSSKQSCAQRKYTKTDKNKWPMFKNNTVNTLQCWMSLHRFSLSFTRKYNTQPRKLVSFHSQKHTCSQRHDIKRHQKFKIFFQVQKSKGYHHFDIQKFPDLLCLVSKLMHLKC